MLTFQRRRQRGQTVDFNIDTPTKPARPARFLLEAVRLARNCSRSTIKARAQAKRLRLRCFRADKFSTAAHTTLSLGRPKLKL